jgi:predicted RNA-binding protein with PIN domain
MSRESRYIVDGNNVMGQRVGWHRDRRGARLRLVRELAAFARRNGARVSVVFDSSADREALARSGPVAVYFSGAGSIADDFIADMVASDPDPGTICVVTSDRGLSGRVKALGARTLRSGDLRRKLDQQAG